MATKVVSDAIGDKMETELVKIENLLIEWKTKKVEDHAMQRFVARILAKIKNLGIVGVVDHAIFKMEMGSVHLLEMELMETDQSNTLNSDRELGRTRATELLSQVMDATDMARLDQTAAGTAWLVNPDSLNIGKPFRLHSRAHI